MKDKLSIFEGRQGEVETRVDLFFVCAKIRDREIADHDVVGYKVKKTNDMSNAKYICFILLKNL